MQLDLTPAQRAGLDDEERELLELTESGMGLTPPTTPPGEGEALVGLGRQDQEIQRWIALLLRVMQRPVVSPVVEAIRRWEAAQEPYDELDEGL